jgi:hypothetical protein
MAPKNTFNPQNILQSLVSSKQPDANFKSNLPQIPLSPTPSNSSKVQNANTNNITPFLSPTR